MDRLKRLSQRWMFYCGLLVGMNVSVDDLKHIQDLIDAEEQGLLLELPCKVGDTIYQVVKGTEDGELFIFPRKLRTKTLLYLLAEKVGKTAFLTKEEAEQKLKELQEKEI